MTKKVGEATAFGLCLLAAAFIILVPLMAHGCGGKPPAVPDKPAPVESYEVPLNDNSRNPDMICLMPGQTAKLLEDVEVQAQVPFENGELFVGTVRVAKGSLVVKPREER